MFGFLLVCCLALLLYYILRRKESDLDGIPGPKALPIVGNALSLGAGKMFLTLADLAQQYGGIFKINFFGAPIVVVNDEPFIQEVLVKQGSQLSGRPKYYRLDLMSDNLSGFAFTDPGPAHLGRKKTIQNYLKRFGSGIQKIEEISQTIIDDLINKIAEENGQPMDIRDSMTLCITSITTMLLSGEAMEEQEVSEMKQSLDTVMQGFGGPSGLLLDKFPFLRFFGNQVYKDIIDFVGIKDRYVKQWLSQRPDNGFVNFLQSLSDREQKAFHVDDFRSQSNTTWEFFAGGIVTTSSSTITLMNVLCHFPDVQEKLRQEVMDIIGPSRYPSLNDRANMPYLHACLMELGRFASAAPLALPHKAVQTCKLLDHTIPKDTEIWVNLWALHHDKKLWDEPFSFKPERFLDADNQLPPPGHPNRRNVMSFGRGMRSCPGEVMASTRMFLILARILQTFKILPETSLENQPSCDPREHTIGMVMQSPPFKIRMVPI